MLGDAENLKEKRDEISVPSMMFPRTEEELQRDIEQGKVYRLSDAFFKYAFGRAKSEELFLDLINALVFPDGSGRFTHVTLINSEYISDKRDGKCSRFDILGVLDDGEHVNLEIQVQKEQGYIKRTLCYWSMAYSMQLKKSESYMTAKRTISVSILGFELYKDRLDFWSSSSVRDDKYFTRTCDDLLLIYIEMPKYFRQIKSGLKARSKFERWLFYLSGMEGDEMEAIALEEPKIGEAMELEHIFMQDDIERMRYISRLKDEMDEIARREREEKYRKAAEEKQRLLEETQKRTALHLLAMNVDISKISEITGLAQEEIERIRSGA